jgi:Protein of unknown function (DUF2922)
MAKTLELTFDGEFGPVKISIRNPKDSLTPAEIKAAMDKMVLANTFTSTNGSLVGTKSARLVDRTTADIVLA